MEHIYLISDIDSNIPFSKRHPQETIRQFLRYDSGYLKDLFYKNKGISFTPNCLKEICSLTSMHNDNWVAPIEKRGNSPFSQAKPYVSPYLFDFNNEDLIAENDARLKRLGYKTA